jgi:hypothetical protein
LARSASDLAHQVLAIARRRERVLAAHGKRGLRRGLRVIAGRRRLVIDGQDLPVTAKLKGGPLNATEGGEQAGAPVERRC